MNVLEVAVYAMVIGNPTQPIKCVESGLGTVNCTNGLAAKAIERDGIKFSNGVAIIKSPGLTLSNGIVAHLDSAGWLEFSNGISVHRDSQYRFRLNNGYTCLLVERTMAECQDGR
ncbi:MAG: hypothetical protein WCK65_07990 [Rhodospirillaceae bacterium]